MKTIYTLRIFLFQIVFIAALCAEPANYRISYDINMSPYAGGNDLLFASKVIEQGGNLWKTSSRSFVGRLARAIDLTLIYLPLNYFASIVQHEVFGHGYRIRDINHGIVSVVGYRFTFPPPYGSGNASTGFRYSPERITTTDLTSISMAGFEAQSILAMQTKLTWLEARRIDPRQTALYLVSQFGINLYAPSEDESDLGHDLIGYTYPLNLTYTDGFLTEKRIQALSWINLVDPFAYFSAYAWCRYIATGKETRIPMIPINGWGYLFGARLGLTPFGPEYFLDNYLLKEKAPIYFYVKAGNHAKNTYLGGGFYAQTLLQKNCFSLGLRFDAWKQPKILLYPGDPFYSSQEQHQTRYGAASSVILTYQKNRALGFEAELGYKSPGFLPGYSLRSKPTIRFSYLSQF